MRQIRLNVIGETITFTKTAAETNGEYLEFVCFLPSERKAAPPKHIHPFQEEYFECIEGELGVFNGNKKKVLLPGQSAIIPANTKHGWFAAGNSNIKFKTVFKPALDIEWLLTETFESMNRAHSARPSIPEACYIFSEMKGQFYLASVPLLIQKSIFPILGKTSKLLGFAKNVKPKSKW